MPLVPVDPRIALALQVLSVAEIAMDMWRELGMSEKELFEKRELLKNMSKEEQVLYLKGDFDQLDDKAARIANK